jgi:hypothetical protein
MTQAAATQTEKVLYTARAGGRRAPDLPYSKATRGNIDVEINVV